MSGWALVGDDVDGAKDSTLEKAHGDGGGGRDDEVAAVGEADAELFDEGAEVVGLGGWEREGVFVAEGGGEHERRVVQRGDAERLLADEEGVMDVDELRGGRGERGFDEGRDGGEGGTQRGADETRDAVGQRDAILGGRDEGDLVAGVGEGLGVGKDGAGFGFRIGSAGVGELKDDHGREMGG